MRELTMNEVQDVNGAFLFMVVPGVIAYGVLMLESAIIAAIAYEQIR